MSKKANPKVVGSFVIGAIALSIIGVMLLGGGSLMEEKFESILYFDESISGLDVGAPVDFQGVRIGTVTEVWMEFDAKSGAAFRPVVMQLEGGRIRHTDGLKPNQDNPEVGMERLVQNRGLRARLASQSMLTGKLKIELGFFPDKPVNRTGRDKGMWEMPTIPSPIRQIEAEVSQLPLTEIVRETHNAIQRISGLLDPAMAGQTVSNINQTLERLESVLGNLDEKIDPLGDHSVGLLKNAEATMVELRETLDRIDANLVPVLTNLNQISGNMNAMISPQSPFRDGMTEVLEDLHETSKSVRRLADYLEQYPEALLRGKN